MAPIRLLALGIFLTSLSLLASTSAGQGIDNQPVAFNQGIAKEPTVEVLDRGLVHEAFAHPAVQNFAPPPALDREPPDPVPELPAEQKPEGDNVQWLPGYWAWDAERKDYTWVSGLYRDLPSGRQYVPGYWARTEEGWRWVPGYFAPEQQAETPQFVPEPPATLDVGPSVAAPDDSSFYSPGSWLYNDGEYYWRPGFWAPYRPGFVWISPRYLWSPGGWIFCNGYWDYPFARRGLLFAPLALRGGWGPGWSYRPRFAVGGLMNGLFWRAGSPFYRFGPYFGANYARAGYRPWFNGPNRFDPVLSYYRWQNRGNAGWLDSMQRSYQVVVKGQNAPRVAVVNQLRNTSIRVTNLTQEQMVRQRVNAQVYRQAALQRGKVEMRRDVSPRVNTPPKAGQPGLSKSVGPATITSPMTAPFPRPATLPVPPKIKQTSPPPANVRPAPTRPSGGSPRPSIVSRSSTRVASRPAYSSHPPTMSPHSTRSDGAPRSVTAYRPATSSYRSSASPSRSEGSYGSRGGGGGGGRGGRR